MNPYLPGILVSCVSATMPFMQSGSQDDPVHLLRDSWILATAASYHISNDRSRFETFEPFHGRLVTAGPPCEVTARGTCEVQVKLKDRDGFPTIILEDVLYLPNC